MFLTSKHSLVKKKMKISGKQVTAARDLLGLTQVELAQAAGLSTDTILAFEAGKTNPYPSSLLKIVSELERRGIEFIDGHTPPSGEDAIGVRLNLSMAAAYARAEKGAER